MASGRKKRTSFPVLKASRIKVEDISTKGASTFYVRILCRNFNIESFARIDEDRIIGNDGFVFYPPGNIFPIVRTHDEIEFTVRITCFQCPECVDGISGLRKENSKSLAWNLG